MSTELDQQVDAELCSLEPQLIAFRRHLHQHPELSGSELRTTAAVAERLAAARVPCRINPTGRGILTEIVPRHVPGPNIALRADMDALPIAEENATSYRSANAGVMHACGHDAHTAMLLAATIALHRVSPLPSGWRSIFQPSEESGQGAREMIESGALDNVQGVVALHVDPNLDLGQIGVTPGPRTACCLDFELDVQGRGGHGARPHLTVDPIAVAAHLITLLYQAVPRHIDSRQPLVLTIGQLQAGYASNVIPDKAEIRGTIRSLHREAVEQARDFVAQLCRGVAASFGAEISVRFDPLLPGVKNDSRITQLCARAVRELFGSEAVIEDIPPSLGAEDFADYLQLVPGCMMNLGVRSPGQSVRPLHTSTFDLDERALLLGAQILARVVLLWEGVQHMEKGNVD